MINHNFFDFERLFINSFKEEVYNIKELVDKELKNNEKKYDSFFIRWIILNNNLDILKEVNKLEFISNIRDDIKNEILDFLRDYKKFSKEILIINLQNKYGLSDEEIEEYLNDLKETKKIYIEKDIISIV